MKIYALLFFVVLAINFEAVFGHVLRRRIGGSVSIYDREDKDDDRYSSYGGLDDDRYGFYGGRNGYGDDDDDVYGEGYDTHHRHDHHHYNYGNPYGGYLRRRTSAPPSPPKPQKGAVTGPKTQPAKKRILSFVG
ncbi:hypothetical protein OSTOST_25352 [Ostertagia ostertagi]